jgi:hypothetical protein
MWAHTSNTARLEQSFQGIAEQVKVRGHKDPQADVFKLMRERVVAGQLICIGMD